MTAPKTALITGITGQDGAYLSALLIEHGYRVIGLSRSRTPDTARLTALSVQEKVTIEHTDLLEPTSLSYAIKEYMPDEVYNFSSQNSVSAAIADPAQTLQYNIHSVLNILEAIRTTHPSTKFFQASSSEMYGPTTDLPITETSPLQPVNPYGASKAAGHLLVQSYREQYGLYAVNGILFNHESPLRSSESFVRHLIQTAARIKEGSDECILLGEPANQRDYGYAPCYVKAMWLSLQAAQPADYIICSGRPVSIRSIAEHVLKAYDIPFDRIVVDPTYVRHPNTPIVYGDNRHTCKALNWRYDLNFFDVLDTLIAAEKIKHE